MDFMKMMKQAKELQGKMGELQSEIAELEAEGNAGAGLVTVRINGQMNVTSVKIDPSLMKPEEVEIVEDLVMAAITDAKTKVEQLVAEKTQEMMGGLGLPPGMKLPFG